MNALQNIVLASIILLYAIAEIASHRHKDFHATRDDTKLELFMFLSLIAVSQPLIFFLTGSCPGGRWPRSCSWATT